MSNAFACDNLVKKYGRVTALRGVTVCVEPGVVGLLGPNGAGKSTLISILLGQTPLTSGRASVLGLSVTKKQRAIRRRVGFMPENDCLIPRFSGIGYVHYAGRLSGMSHADAMQRAHEVLDYVDLDEARYRPAEQYSTGMKQRLKLAQALVHDPDMLFLDEPTNGMDPQGRQVMLNLIQDLGNSGISILLSSHLLPDVEKVCRYVVIMGGGELLATGEISEMTRPHPTKYGIEFTGNDGVFRDKLIERHVSVSSQRSSGQLDIEIPDPNSQRLIIEAARDSQTNIIGLHPQRSSLEEGFLEALRKQQG